MNEFNTTLTDIKVEYNRLLYEGKQITEFPSDICEIARLEDKLLVVLDGHTIPPDMLYAGSNFWAVDLKGNLLWKAQQLNENFYENSLYLKSSPYPSLLGEYYNGLSLLDDTNPVAFTSVWRDEPILIDLETGKTTSGKKAADRIKNAKIFLSFQKIKNAKGADLKETAIDWPSSFHQSLKASDQLQIALKMTEATVAKQIDLILKAIENIDPEVVYEEAMDRIRINFQDYCRDRMNVFFRNDEAPINLRQLPKVIDEFFVGLNIKMPPRGSYYGWPAMKQLPLKNPKD